jgi:hypothetical protein
MTCHGLCCCSLRGFDGGKLVDQRPFTLDYPSGSRLSLGSASILLLGYRNMAGLLGVCNNSTRDSERLREARYWLFCSQGVGRTKKRDYTNHECLNTDVFSQRLRRTLQGYKYKHKVKGKKDQMNRFLHHLTEIKQDRCNPS